MAEARDDYYAVLGIPRQASAAEITRAYRRALRRLHPDTHARPDDREHDAKASEARPGVGAGLALLREAFAVLGDPARRAAYDRRTQLAPARRPATPPARQRRAPFLTDPPEPPLRAGPVYYRPYPPTGR